MASMGGEHDAVTTGLSRRVQIAGVVKGGRILPGKDHPYNNVFANARQRTPHRGYMALSARFAAVTVSAMS